MADDNAPATGSELGKVLKCLFPTETFLHEGARHRCERLKLIVTYDDWEHYARSSVIVDDIERDRSLAREGYRIVRIPYFVQVSPEVVSNLFGVDDDSVIAPRAQGFVGPENLLPADYCALGLERFRSDLRRFPFIAPAILASLQRRIAECGDARLVVPAAIEDILGAEETAIEGVTKFRLQFRKAPPPDACVIAPLNAWRTILHRLGLVSRDAHRYSGAGFGNVSLRQPVPFEVNQKPSFLISGSQTGGMARLTEWHYCRVTDYALDANALTAEGPIPPSSESLTHAAVYEAAPNARCVLHVHSPEMWQQAASMELPSVGESIDYGTPAMAEAVGKLVRHRPAGILAMRGHRDGIVAYGPSVAETAASLIQCLAKALQAATE